jgi:hypothetical protein
MVSIYLMLPVYFMEFVVVYGMSIDAVNKLEVF